MSGLDSYEYTQKLQADSDTERGNLQQTLNDRVKVSHLADEYHVTRHAIYKIINRGRQKDFSLHKSTNAHCRCLEWGIRRLVKVEKELEDKLKKETDVTIRTTQDK
jgi:predicted DNA-binding protein YlxM (UPF0122 family)